MFAFGDISKGWMIMTKAKYDALMLELADGATAHGSDEGCLKEATGCQIADSPENKRKAYKTSIGDDAYKEDSDSLLTMYHKLNIKTDYNSGKDFKEQAIPKSMTIALGKYDADFDNGDGEPKGKWTGPILYRESNR